MWRLTDCSSHGWRPSLWGWLHPCCWSLSSSWWQWWWWWWLLHWVGCEPLLLGPFPLQACILPTACSLLPPREALHASISLFAPCFSHVPCLFAHSLLLAHCLCPQPLTSISLLASFPLFPPISLPACLLTATLAGKSTDPASKAGPTNHRRLVNTVLLQMLLEGLVKILPVSCTTVGILRWGQGKGQTSLKSIKISKKRYREINLQDWGS